MGINDPAGRDISWPFAVRGAMVTASVTVTTGTNTLLIAGDADYLLDLVEASLSNQSTVAAQVTIKDDGTAVRTLELVQGLYELTPQMPIIQSKAGSNWSVDMEDITGTTVNVDATFIKNTKQ